MKLPDHHVQVRHILPDTDPPAVPPTNRNPRLQLISDLLAYRISSNRSRVSNTSRGFDCICSIHSFFHSYSFISLYDTSQQTMIQATLQSTITLVYGTLESCPVSRICPGTKGQLRPSGQFAEGRCFWPILTFSETLRMVYRHFGPRTLRTQDTSDLPKFGPRTLLHDRSVRTLRHQCRSVLHQTISVLTGKTNHIAYYAKAYP